MATRKIVPRADNEGGIGTALKRWAAAFIAAITCTTINALTLAAQSVGFTIAGGTTSKTLTVDETVAMSDKAPKTDTIKGDGTAGRVLRVSRVNIFNGTNPSTIKVSTTAFWNGDENAAEDNLAPGGDGTAFSLNATNVILTWKNAGISGSCVAILAYNIEYNGSTVALQPLLLKTANGITLEIIDPTTGTNLGWTTTVDTGILLILVAYLTDA